MGSAQTPFMMAAARVVSEAKDMQVAERKARLFSIFALPTPNSGNITLWHPFLADCAQA